MDSHGFFQVFSIIVKILDRSVVPHTGSALHWIRQVQVVETAPDLTGYFLLRSQHAIFSPINSTTRRQKRQIGARWTSDRYVQTIQRHDCRSSPPRFLQLDF